MANYKIRVDSSTKTTNGIKYGKSAAAWTIEINGHLTRAGLIYCNVHGPNKILYEGILASLATLESEHFFSGGTDNVEILVDCQIIVDQLNGQSANRMKKHKKLVQEFCKRHQNVTFSFLYQNEQNPSYKKVDILSKVGRGWMPKMI